MILDNISETSGIDSVEAGECPNASSQCQVEMCTQGISLGVTNEAFSEICCM